MVLSYLILSSMLGFYVFRGASKLSYLILSYLILGEAGVESLWVSLAQQDEARRHVFHARVLCVSGSK